MAKTLTGIVTSESRDKTITVTVTSRETHPISKTKSFKLDKIVEKSVGSIELKDDEVEA